MKKSLLTLISALCLSSTVNAADIRVQAASDSDKRNVMLISGQIVEGDYKKFLNALKTVPNGKSFLILLDGPGGSLYEAINIGLDIHKLKYDTVAYKGICASACAYIWLAGERAIIDMDQDAKVGFHAPYILDKFGNKRKDSSASALLGGYLKEIGADYKLIMYATSVDGDEIQWLTESHAKELRLAAEFLRQPPKVASTENLPTKTFTIASGGTLTVTVTSQNRPHGSGIFKLNDGHSESLTFVNGVKHGPAIYTFANGDRVFYQYVNGKRQGESKKILTTGVVEVWTVIDNSPKGQTWKRFNPEGQLIASGVFQ